MLRAIAGCGFDVSVSCVCVRAAQVAECPVRPSSLQACAAGYPYGAAGRGGAAPRRLGPGKSQEFAGRSSRGGGVADAPVVGGGQAQPRATGLGQAAATGCPRRLSHPLRGGRRLRRR